MMHPPLRLALACAALFLASCGAEAQKGEPAKAGEAGGVTLSTTEHMPDWLLIARTPDRGFIHFNQRTITRGADGTADIWVQVTHGSNQIYEFETPEAKTTIRYTQERVHYRFNCAEEKFIVVERQIMGPGDEIVGRDEPSMQIYRATPDRGAARIVLPIACRGT